MLCWRLHLWLQPGTRFCFVPRQSAHKLTSLKKLTGLTERKLQGLLYPFNDLEIHLDRSVDRSQFKLFHPSMEDMTRAERFFLNTPGHKIDYHTSAERMDHAPVLKPPEVCFIGRSNAGKSSLIKALFSMSPQIEVRVSKTPGRTRKMNFFKVGKAFTMVDMPGYGYRAPKDFAEMVEPYLDTRENLARIFILVDGTIGLQKLDYIALEMCEEFRRPYVIVLTKIDRSRQGELLTNLLQTKEVIDAQKCCFPQPFLISSLHYSGVYMLRCFIAHVTGNMQLDASRS